jgi:hypothetical protein
VKRNAARFPTDVMFQLKPEEHAKLKFQFGLSSWGGRRRSRPSVFTEQGIAMLSRAPNSDRVIKVNIAIMRAFVRLRQILDTNRELARKFSELERRVGKHDKEIAAIIEAIRQLMTPLPRARKDSALPDTESFASACLIA